LSTWHIAADSVCCPLFSVRMGARKTREWKRREWTTWHETGSNGTFCDVKFKHV